MRGRLPPDYKYFYIALSSVVGLLLGSFLNVCIYRIPRDVSVVTPRSFCPKCGIAIAWYDNIPILSYFLLRRRCRGCAQPIPARYPVVELTTAILFGFVSAEYGWSLAALKWFVFEGLLVALFWTDIEERILPDELTLGGAVAGVILALFVPVPSAAGWLLTPNARMPVQSLIGAGMGAVVLVAPIWALGALYSKIRKREGLGLGDVKLLLLMAVFLGLERGLFALLIGSVGGTVIGGGYILLTRRNPSTYALPFGTFLCAGAAATPLVSRWV
jgi:leader peptidase (prepilin peptidase) / N-methyltransferase